MTKAKVMMLITAMCLAMGASSVLARSWFDTKPKSDHVDRVQQYKIDEIKAVKDGDEDIATSTTEPLGASRRSLGVASPAAGSPGVVIKNTWDDWQWTYAGHHVEWRGKPYVQFSYNERALGAAGVSQHAYNGYQPIGGTWPQGPEVGCVKQVGEDEGLYPNLDVKSNGRVVMAGHQTTWTAGALRDNVIWYQSTTPFACTFSASVIDSSQYKAGMVNYSQANSRLYQVLIELQEWNNDTVTHLIGQTGASFGTVAGKSDLSTTTIQYFRKMTFSGAATWVGPVSLDTVQRMAHICASRVSPKVAVTYLRYTPEASSNTQFPNGNSNDQAVYYRESDSIGLVWKPKVNITPYNRVAGPSYSPWVEAKALYDANDKLHIIFNAMPIPTNPYGTLWDRWNLMVTGSSLLHWSNSTNTISRIYNAEWATAVYDDPAFCGWIGTNMLSLGAFGISECNGRLYTVWTMSTDVDAATPVIGDCASGGFGSIVFAANGELFLSVSSDLSGLLWDNHRNLTNTRTPNCDSSGFGGICYNDAKPTMARYGMNISTFDTNGFPVTLNWPDTGVNPGPGPYTGNHYIHLQYLEDQYPGQKVIQGTSTVARGEWKLNPLKWMRLACVAPVTAPQISHTPTAFGYPEWTRHNKPDTTTITVTNDGNATLNVTTIGMVKTTNTGVDWLGTTVPSLIVNAGIGNTATFGVIVNKGATGAGFTPGTIVSLSGEVYLKSNAVAPKDSVSIMITGFVVADTMVGLTWDTVTTGCTRLIVSNHGNVGRGGLGTVNMDYYALGGECDLVATNQKYLYDGGPIAIRKSGLNYVYSNALFQGNFTTEQAFKPYSSGTGAGTIIGAGYDGFYTGTFVNKDTTIGVRRTYYAPTAGTDTCNFIVQKSVFFGLGGPKANVTLGEAIDWDIPTYLTASANASDNDGRVLISKNVVYQQGLDTLTAFNTRCIKRSNRFGSIAFLGMYTPAEKTADTCANDVNMYGAYVMLNDTLFKYDTLSNSAEGAFYWSRMSAGGLTAASTQAKDLHMVMTYKHDIPSLDTLTVFSAIVSVKDGDTTVLKAGIDKAAKWYMDHLRPGCGGCCLATSDDGLTGNMDAQLGSGIDISDVTALINNLYIPPYTPFVCVESANMDGDWSPGWGIDISDVTALFNRLYIPPYTPLAPCQ